MASRLYRTLLIAEAANPAWASVPLVGWSHSSALAKVTNAHIVTHVRNRKDITEAGLVEGREFSAIDNEHIAGPIYKLAKLLRGGTQKAWTTNTALSAISYYSFERIFWNQFKDRLLAKEFDLVHRITPLSPTHPSIIAKRLAKIGIPFIIGPLNGGVPWPRQFLDRQHAEREWLSHARGLYKLMPGYASTLKYSSAIILGSKFTYSEIPNWAQEKCVYIPENGIDSSRFDQPRTRTASIPLTAAFVGRLVPYKGADMLIEAAKSFLKDGQLKLEIFGEGPQRPELEAMVDNLGLRKNVLFHGWVPHVNMQKMLRNCDLLVLPSVREFGGAVVIEAMALGVTPIVANYAGPSELVNSEIGFRVDFTDRLSLIHGLHQAFLHILQNPSILDKMGAAGRAKVGEKFTWEAKAKQIISVYDAVLSGTKNLQSLSFNLNK